MKKFALAALAVVSLMPFAAKAADSISVAEFDALPELTAQDLTARLTDKVFEVAWPNGKVFRMDFRSNGYVYINVGSANGSRKWRVEGSSICLEGKGENFCNPARADATGLIVKAQTGDSASRYIQK